MGKKHMFVRYSKDENLKTQVNKIAYDELASCVAIIKYFGKSKTGFPYKQISKASVTEFLINRYLKELKKITGDNS